MNRILYTEIESISSVFFTPENAPLPRAINLWKEDDFLHLPRSIYIRKMIIIKKKKINNIYNI